MSEGRAGDVLETAPLRRLCAVAPLLTERVCAADAVEVLAALAATREPAPTTLLAEVLERPIPEVGPALARAAQASLVRQQGAGIAFTHPLVRAAAITLAGPDRMSALHAAFARLLDRAGNDLGPAVVDLAAHRMAAGESGPGVLQACLQAAEWSWQQADLPGTMHWTEYGLTLVPDGRAKARLLHLHGLSALRSGAVATGIQDLRTAVEISGRSDDGAAHAAITLDLLQARSLARVFDPDTVSLVTGALRRCPVTRAELRARLVSHLAESAGWHDPARNRRLARAAVDLARSSGDGEALAFAVLVGQLAPVPGQPTGTADDLAGLASSSATARTAAGLAAGHAALVTGDRWTVEELSRDLHRRPGGGTSPPDDWGAALAAHLQVAVSLLDGDGPRISRAVRHLTAFAPQWAELASLVGACTWPELVGMPGPRTWRWFPGAQTPSWLAALRGAAGSVHRATHPVVRIDELSAVAARLPRPAGLVRDIAWPAWLALIAHVGALLGDRELCAEAAEALRPYSGTFLVLGIATPVGPAGWFLARALLRTGHLEEALAANRAALGVSARLRSRPWMHRCRTQRENLLAAAPHPPDQRSPHADAAQRLAALRATDRRLLGWVGRGMTNRAIARRLSVSVSTVERRLSSIYRTLGVSNRAQAVGLLAAFGR
jgi:DNA-binding CsgD family transcriptional regulator